MDKATKTALITGGNSGLGFQCARRVAADPSWHIVLACRDSARAEAAVLELKAESRNAGVEDLALGL